MKGAPRRLVCQRQRRPSGCCAASDRPEGWRSAKVEGGTLLLDSIEPQRESELRSGLPLIQLASTSMDWALASSKLPMHLFLFLRLLLVRVLVDSEAFKTSQVRLVTRGQ